jgi:hypothetical protein
MATLNSFQLFFSLSFGTLTLPQCCFVISDVAMDNDVCKRLMRVWKLWYKGNSGLVIRCDSQPNVSGLSTWRHAWASFHNSYLLLIGLILGGICMYACVVLCMYAGCWNTSISLLRWISISYLILLATTPFWRVPKLHDSINIWRLIYDVIPHLLWCPHSWQW